MSVELWKSYIVSALWKKIISHYFGKGVVGLDPGDAKLEVDEEKSNFKEFGDDSLLLIVDDHASPLSSDLREDGLGEIGSELTSSSIMSLTVEVVDSKSTAGLFLQTSEKLYLFV